MIFGSKDTWLNVRSWKYFKKCQRLPRQRIL